MRQGALDLLYSFSGDTGGALSQLLLHEARFWEERPTPHTGKKLCTPARKRALQLLINRYG